MSDIIKKPFCFPPLPRWFFSAIGCRQLLLALYHIFNKKSIFIVQQFQYSFFCPSRNPVFLFYFLYSTIRQVYPSGFFRKALLSEKIYKILEMFLYVSRGTFLFYFRALVGSSRGIPADADFLRSKKYSRLPLTRLSKCGMLFHEGGKCRPLPCGELIK